MVKVKYIVRYFVEYYPYKEELSKARLTKMVYLADWYNALEKGVTLTKINWYFDHYGPYVDDVYNVVKDDSRLYIKKTKTPFGNDKQLICLKEGAINNLLRYKLNDEVVEILEKVIEDTKLLYWNDFIKYVYSTSPIKTSDKYTHLNLVHLAQECRKKGVTI